MYMTTDFIRLPAAVAMGLVIGYLTGYYNGGLRAERAERDLAIVQLQKAIDVKQDVEARYEAAKEVRISADAVARAELERLRKSIASAGQAPATSAGTDGVRAEWAELFDESASGYLEMAAEAGRLANKINALQNYINQVGTP